MKRFFTNLGSVILLCSAQCFADSSTPLPGDGENSQFEKIAMVNSLYKKALSKINSGDNSKASQIFDEVLTQHPEHRQARLQQGRILIESGKPAQAIEILAPLLVTDDANWEPWFWMGTASLLSGDLDNASSYLDTALSYNGQITDIWLQRAIVAQEQGNYEGSLQLLRIAIELSPDNPLIWLNYAYVNDHMDNKNKAITAYRQFLKLSANQTGFSEQRNAVVSILLGKNF